MHTFRPWYLKVREYSIPVNTNVQTRAHTRDQGWGKKEPNSSQSGPEWQPLSPPAHSREGAQEPASASPQLCHPPLGGSPQLRTSGERFPKGEGTQLRASRKSGREEAEVSWLHPAPEEVRESQAQPGGSVTTPKSLLPLNEPGSPAHSQPSELRD